MTSRPDADLWALARAERMALADDLAQLTEEQWHSRTLCGEWTVEEVTAHLIAAASTNQWRWLRSMIGARFDPDVHNQRRLDEYRGSSPADTLRRFRSIVDSTTAPSGHTPAYLGEIVVHAQDIRQPLGLTHTPSVDALIPVAEFFAQRDFAVQSKTRTVGVHLTADDAPFAAGTGPDVTGPVLALVMAMAGREAYLDQLSGPGLPTFRDNLR